MKEFARLGHKPIVITSDSNNLIDAPQLNSKVETHINNDVTLVWLKTMKYEVAKSSRRVLSWFHFEWNLFCLKKNELPKPDVIIVSSLSLLTILNGLCLSRKYNCKLVFEIRDIWPLTIVEEGGYSKKNPFVMMLSFVERIGYKYSNLIVGTMPNLGAHVKDVLGYERPVCCIPMGVDAGVLSEQSTVDDNYVNQYLRDDYFNVVHAGTIGITNALEFFFKAAEILKDKEKIRFVIVGDGALKSYFQSEFSHLSNVVFAPKVKKNMVQSVLSHADLVYFSVYKSKVWDYGQSLNKVVDYMLSGKPILASYSGYPSMINEARCGFFTPAEDSISLANEILRLSSIPEAERVQMGLNGKEWIICNRSYRKLASDYLSLLFENDADLH